MRKFLALVAMSVVFACNISHAQTFELKTLSNLSASGRGGLKSADVNQDGLIDVIFSGKNDIGDNFAAVYRNNGDDTFTNLGVGIDELVDGDISIADVNNDGLPDILSIGVNESSEKITQLLLNEGSGVFNESSYDFEGYAFGVCKMADLNNDGLTDIIITGLNSAGSTVTDIYINEGADQFTVLDHAVPGVSSGDLEVFDFNNDSYLDVLVSGIGSGNQRLTELHINNKNNGFELKNVGLPDLRSTSLSIGDFNMDGFADLFISGNKSATTDISEIYKNNSGAAFILEETFPDLEQGSSQWGDYDHDGDLDLLINGLEGSSFKTYLYENTLPGFTDSGIGFPGLTEGEVSWLDYNNDDKLDLLINGYSSLGPITNLYENVLGSTNTIPAAPTNLQSEVKGDSVTFSWDSGTDTETLNSGLTYKLYVGSSAGDFDINSPEADLTNGFRKVIDKGIHEASFTLKEVPEGIYFWGVQSIDNGYNGSAFSSEESFTVCHPIALAAQDTSICIGSILSLEEGSGTDVVDWYSEKNGLIEAGTQQIDFEVVEDDSIYVEVTKDLGCVVKTGIKITALSLPNPDLGSDKEICIEQSLQLSLSLTDEQATWSSTREGVFSTESSIDYSIYQDDTVSVIVENSNGCFGYDTVNIKAIELPLVDLGDNQTLCYGNDINLTAAGDSVNWETANGLELLNSNAFAFEVLQKDTVMASVFNLTTGCQNSDTLAVNFNELPLADAGEDKVTCAGTTIEIGGAYDDIVGLSFNWTPDGTLNDATLVNPVASPSQKTSHILTVTDGNGCENNDSMTVFMDSVSVVSVGSDRPICIGASTELGGVPTAVGSQLEYSYQWSPEESLNDPSSANPVAIPDATTTYRLITKTADCVIDTSYVEVIVNPLPIVEADPEEVTIGFGEVITIIASGGESYVWSPSIGLESPLNATTDASPEETTTYEVEATDVNGCKSTAETHVIVKNRFFIPEVFTPNGDQSNDTFKAFGDGVERLELRIYDRNGLMVYQSDDVAAIMDTGWDGSFEGVPLENGQYVWAVSGQFFDGSPVEFKGKTSGILKLIR